MQEEKKKSRKEGDKARLAAAAAAWAFSRDGLRMRRSRSSSPLTASMLRERASRSAV